MGKYVELMVVVVISMMSMMVIMGSSEFDSNNNIQLVVGSGIKANAGIVKCTPNGGMCASQDCCAGNLCKISLFSGAPMGYCTWCPTAGYPCGALDPCCPGYTCDGTFSGTCH
ncbi:unnamed protein product [Amaranthus hypochondriacus]